MIVRAHLGSKSRYIDYSNGRNERTQQRTNGGSNQSYESLIFAASLAPRKVLEGFGMRAI
jgi:hypothetical protein